MNLHKFPQPTLSCINNPAGAGLSDTISSLLPHLLLLGLSGETSGVITNVSIIQSWRWFFHLSAFESVFLYFVIAQISVMSFLGIIPINLSELWQGEASGRKRRKRRSHALPTSNNNPFTPPPPVALAQIGVNLLTLYTKLDTNKCGPRALCELQRKVSCVQPKPSNDDKPLSPTTELLLDTLLKFSYFQPLDDGGGHAATKNLDTVAAVTEKVTLALKPYTEAARLGDVTGKKCVCQSHTRNNNNIISVNVPNFSTASTGYSAKSGNYNETWTQIENENECERKYRDCPASTEEILFYVERIDSLHYF